MKWFTAKPARLHGYAGEFFRTDKNG